MYKVPARLPVCVSEQVWRKVWRRCLIRPLIGIPLSGCGGVSTARTKLRTGGDRRAYGRGVYAWFNTGVHRRLGDYQVGKATEISEPEGCRFTGGLQRVCPERGKPPSAGTPQMPCRFRDYLRLAPERALSRVRCGTTPNCFMVRATKSPDRQRAGRTESGGTEYPPAFFQTTALPLLPIDAGQQPVA